MKQEFTNPFTNEKFIHKEKSDGTIDFYYGPKDTPEVRNHGHAVFDSTGRVVFNRNPFGE